MFCSATFVLIFDFGTRACYSTTWYSDVIGFHFYPDPIVHTRFVFIRFRERFQTYTNLLDPIRVLVWTYQKVYGFERIRVSVDGP